MTEFLKGQPHVIDRDTILTLLQRRWDETTGGRKEPGVSWVLNQLADVEVIAFREPVDDPAKDEIGTVRTSAAGVVVAKQSFASSNGWAVVWDCGATELDRYLDANVTGWLRTGTVPGTPAWEKEQADSENQRDELAAALSVSPNLSWRELLNIVRRLAELAIRGEQAVREPRMFSSEDPEPPADVKAVEWLDRPGPGGSPYLVRVGTGWMWSDAANRVVPEREGSPLTWPAATTLFQGRYREVFPS